MPKKYDLKRKWKFKKSFSYLLSILILLTIIILLCIRCNGGKQKIETVVDTSVSGYQLVEDPEITDATQTVGNAQIYSAINHDNFLNHKN
jgi:hypothetical protein